MVSPLTGPAGNVEFLVHGRKGVTVSAPMVGRLLSDAVDEADATPIEPR
jgi:hypothetical protein